MRAWNWVRAAGSTHQIHGGILPGAKKILHEWRILQLAPRASIPLAHPCRPDQQGKWKKRERVEWKGHLAKKGSTENGLELGHFSAKESALSCPSKGCEAFPRLGNMSNEYERIPKRHSLVRHVNPSRLAKAHMLLPLQYMFQSFVLRIFSKVAASQGLLLHSVVSARELPAVPHEVTTGLLETAVSWNLCRTHPKSNLYNFIFTALLLAMQLLPCPTEGKVKTRKAAATASNASILLPN